MADRERLPLQPYQPQQQTAQASPVKQVVKATTAVALGGGLLTLSGLLLVGTVLALTIATPVLVLFSPVLVPAVITVSLIGTGFFASGGFGVAAATVFTFMYKQITGTSNVPSHLATKARDIKEHLGQQLPQQQHPRGPGGQSP
ncbi:Oleosin 1-like [Ranunculus cassubicifolius]